MEIYSSTVDAVITIELLQDLSTYFKSKYKCKNHRFTIFPCLFLKVFSLGVSPPSSGNLPDPFKFWAVFGPVPQDYNSVMHYSRFSFSKETYTQDLTETWRCFFAGLFLFWESNGIHKTWFLPFFGEGLTIKPWPEKG